MIENLTKDSDLRRETNLGSDGDTAFAFEGIRIHGALVWDIGAALTEQAVHESRLAVVDMSNNRDVAEAGGVERSGGIRRRSSGGSSGEGAGEETRGRWRET